MNFTYTDIGTTLEPDSDGTVLEYKRVTAEGGVDLDMDLLREDVKDFKYYRGPGQQFCSRIAILPHPYDDGQAVVVLSHQLDI
jgi:hypothetical protein